jgi:hypothetical protein
MKKPLWKQGPVTKTVIAVEVISDDDHYPEKLVTKYNKKPPVKGAANHPSPCDHLYQIKCSKGNRQLQGIIYFPFSRTPGN